MIHYKKRSEKDLFDDYYAIFSDFLYKGICCGCSFELHRLVDAIQMSTHNICLYKEVDKKYTGCNLKTMELLDCALIGICAVIRLNTVFIVVMVYMYAVKSRSNSPYSCSQHCCTLVGYKYAQDLEIKKHTQ